MPRTDNFFKYLFALGTNSQRRLNLPLMKSESRDGMRIDWDVPIEMDDGLVLRADVFRPVPEGRYPVIMTHGPYAKGLAFQEGFKSMWNRPLDDEYYKARSPVWEKVTVPLLSANNWGGQGLHPRGNLEGYVRAASKQKWLECYGLAHWPHFYTDYGRLLQKRFFDFFLKGEKNGWDKQPPVQLQVRQPGEKFVERHENEWPLARTQWTKFYLQPGTLGLQRQPPGAEASITYETTGDGVTFCTPPLNETLEITGPVAGKLFLSSATNDADVFLVLRVFDTDGKEVTFQGALDPRTPIGQGWLRASHRKLDPELTKPYRPYHTHDEVQPLTPGEVYELDIEIWPTCIVVPPRYRIGLTVRGKDYQSDGPSIVIPDAPYPFTGVGPFFHTHPQDRPAEIFEKTNTLHFGPMRQPYVLLPVIPPKESGDD